MKPITKIILGILILFVVLIGGGALYLTTQFDPNAYKAQIATKVSETLGRKLTINGPLGFSAFPSLKLSLTDVTLGNADWAGTQPMAQVKNLEASLALMPLLSHQIVIEGVTLKGATLNLMQQNGRNNWTFASATPAQKPGAELQKKEPAQPLSLEILSLAITDTTLNYNNNGKLTNLVIADAKTSVRPSDPLALTAKGTLNGAPLEVTIKGDKFAGILSNAENWPVNGKINLASTEISFDGTVHHPQNFGGGDFKLTASGNGKDMAPVTGTPLPFGKFDMEAKLTMPNAQNASLSDFNFSTGQTKATGQLKLSLAGKPNINGELNIPTLNLADFAGGNSPAPAAPGKQGLNIISHAYAADLVPAIPLPTAALRAANANIKLNIGDIIQNGAKLGSLDSTINLADGNLNMSPMKLVYGGNTFTGNINLDGRSDIAALTANLASPQLDYGKLLTELKMTDRIKGIGALTLNLTGNGRDLHQVMATSHGKFLLTSSQGEFDTAILFGGMGNVLRTALPNYNLPQTAQLRCAVFDFTGTNGIWTTTQSAADSNVVAVALAGDVDLANDKLNLKALPNVKSVKTAGLIPPIKISGDITHPAVMTDGSSLAQSVVTASVLGKVKGLDILSGLAGNKNTGAPSGPAGNACMAAVQQAAGANAPKSTPASSTGTTPSSGSKLNNTLKGLQGLFGK